jgi:HSP20 family protein
MLEEKVRNGAYTNNERVLVPLADIFETADYYTLKLEMPGVTRESLDVMIENNEMEIRGKVSDNSPDNMEVKYSEFSHYDFFRKFSVGNDIDRNKIEATFENGVLTLVLHKLEAVKPKKISINVH